MPSTLTTQTTVTYEGARRAIEAAVAEAARIGAPSCIAVADRAGVLLAFARMDGAPPMSIQIAQDKAYTVTAFNQPTADWWPMLADNPPLLHGIVKTDRLIIFGGGVPITADGVIVGAVGSSGGTAEEDIQVAEAGARAALG